MRILDLHVMFGWYDMIYFREKPEEYRDITPYWFKRFIDYNPEWYDQNNPIPTYFNNTGHFKSPANAISWDMDIAKVIHFKEFTHVRFHRGYTNVSMLLECKEIYIDYGNPDWGAPEDRKVFIIKLGNRVYENSSYDPRDCENWCQKLCLKENRHLDCAGFNKKCPDFTHKTDKK